MASRVRTEAACLKSVLGERGASAFAQFIELSERVAKLAPLPVADDDLAPADYARVRCAAPMGLRHRISPDSAWPLRCADGRTFAERKGDKA